MKLLGLDFETQNDDAKTTPITEIGARLVETDQLDLNGVPTSLDFMEAFVYHPDYPPQSEEVIELTGITDEILKTQGIPPRTAIERLIPLVEQSDIVMAHNGKKFDQVVLQSVCARMGVPLVTREWFCTLQDMDWPKKYSCKKLAHLAYEHGLLMDHRELHRALNDVDLMLELVFSKYNFQDMLKWSREPWTYLRAEIPGPWIGRGGDGGVGKAQASKLGYAWERAKYTDEPVFPKFWVKRVKATLVEQEKALAPFPVHVLN